MKTPPEVSEAVNIITGKDRTRNLYEVIFDSKQTEPRVTLGSQWIATDKRYSRKYIVRVVDIGYSDDFDLKLILAQIRENPAHSFDTRAYDYYCSEKAWIRIESELSGNHLKPVYDQPTILQTFLSPTSERENFLIANADFDKGIPIGNLRSGDKKLGPVVTIDDKFVSHRTLITGSSGFGKSTLVRNILRYWIEKKSYGKIIDDLKGEYIDDIPDESKAGDAIPGLCHHPSAKENLFFLTSSPYRYDGLDSKIAGVIPLKFSIEDIPVDSLKDVATHITEPQRTFLEMYQDKPNLFQILLKEKDGNPDVSNWQREFNGWIVLSKTSKKDKDDDDPIAVSDILPSSYTPIHNITKQLRKLISRPFMSLNKSESCLGKLRELLGKGATIVLDKNGLTESDRIIISTVIANDLYKHNARNSAGNRDLQRNVIPFVYLIEEAHLLLSTPKLKEGSVFVDFSKTGRSFQIGLVAVTQRPSSLDRDILTQFDNFVTLRLTNESDVKDLIGACDMFKGYDGDIRSAGPGSGIVAFGEPPKVQSVKIFEWTAERAGTLVSAELESLKKQVMVH